MSSNIGAIVTKITKDATTIVTEHGHEVELPRYFGESPAVGTAVVLDMSGGGHGQIYTTPPISKVGTTKRYMNFYAVEEDGNTPDQQPKQKDMKTAENQTTNIAPYSPFGFADTPSGARTMAAGNGNMVFAGPTSAGIVTSCESKMIVRDDGTAELVTPHYMALLGRTIVVSTFHDNITIEIDINTTEASGGTAGIDDIKNKIADLVVGEDGPPITYEEAFEQSVTGDSNEAFFRMFGLHLGELLLTFKWERLKYRGSEKTFHEVFGGLGSFDTIYIYCQNCYGKDTIASVEFFLKPGFNNNSPVAVNVPSCETDVHSTIMPINAYFNGEEYEAYVVNMTLKSGSTIEYALAKRVYALSHGIIAKGSWTSAERHALFADNFHANVDTIAFPSISVIPNAPGYCGASVGMPTITWGGDFTLNVLGDASIAASGTASLYGAAQAIIGGGTKGILVDSTGSSAITL